MSPNILVTGAAGYIGGSIVADFLASDNTLLGKENVIAAVRSQEQAEAVSKLGIKVLQLDLSDEKSVEETLLQHSISVVIQTASSINPSLSLPLITALGKQKEATGEQTYFIHTSGMSAFYEKTGWPPGETKDTDPIFDIEKQFAESFPIRKTDVAVTEHAEAQGVTSFIVVPSTVYGKGTGEWNKLSIVLPVYIKALISRQRVYKFADDTKKSGVHISDMTALYRRIVEKILQQEVIPSGKAGHYFALAHELHWWEFLDHLAVALKARGLVTDVNTEIWPSDEAAAEALGVPAQFVQALWNSGENMITEKNDLLMWEPAWDKEKFIQHIDDEIAAVLELDTAKSSLIDSLNKAAKG